MFEVAKNARRPFVVRASGSEVVALGTVFSIRLLSAGRPHADSLAVTLIEGQVSVRPSGGKGVAPRTPLLMKPGQRVRFVESGDSQAAGAVAKLDQPPIEEVVAWKRNEVVFNNLSLADAVTEMNRYSRTPMVLVGDEALASHRVSGQFRAGDNMGFGNAVAALHGLLVRQQQGRIELGPSTK